MWMKREERESQRRLLINNLASPMQTEELKKWISQSQTGFSLWPCLHFEPVVIKICDSSQLCSSRRGSFGVIALLFANARWSVSPLNAELSRVINIFTEREGHSKEIDTSGLRSRLPNQFWTNDRSYQNSYFTLNRFVYQL